MQKEHRNIDFATSGKDLSETDFKRVSEWIKERKKANATKEVKQEAGALSKVAG